MMIDQSDLPLLLSLLCSHHSHWEGVGSKGDHWAPIEGEEMIHNEVGTCYNTLQSFAILIAKILLDQGRDIF